MERRGALTPQEDPDLVTYSCLKLESESNPPPGILIYVSQNPSSNQKLIRIGLLAFETSVLIQSVRPLSSQMELWRISLLFPFECVVLHFICAEDQLILSGTP